MSRRRAALPLAVLGLLLALGGCGPGKPDASARVADGTVHLLLINRLQGQAEGIPCREVNIPPLAAAVGARDRLVASGESAVLVLVGDTLVRSSETRRPKPVDTPLRARGDVVLEAIAASHPAAWVPGPTDLSYERMDATLERAAALGIPVLLSNLAAPAHPEIKPWIVVQAGTLRVGLLGVLPTRLAEMDSAKLAKEGKDGEDKGPPLVLPGASVLPPRETIERLAAQLRAQQDVDVVVLLSELSGKANNSLLGAGMHIILGSSEGKASADSLLTAGGKVAMGNCLPGGEEVAHTIIKVVRGSMAFVPIAATHTLPAEVARDQASLDELVQRYGTDDVEQLARQASPGTEADFKRRVLLLEDNKEWLAMAASERGSTFDHFVEPLQQVAPDHPVQVLLAGQGAAIEKAMATTTLPPPPESAELPTISLPDTCVSCHPAQYEFWKGTAHARAVDTLVAMERQHDPACLKCHAAGYDDQLGWTDPRLESPLGAVTCWSCHKTTRQHVDKPRQAVDPQVAGLPTHIGMGCESCHTHQRFPAFDRLPVLASVSCPPMRDDEAPIVLARQAAIDQIALRRSKDIAEPRDDYLEARALVGLGREEGWVALRKFAATNTADVNTAIEIAQLCDTRGRTAQGIEAMIAFLEHQPGDERANWVLADLLLHGRDPAARDPAQAAQRLALMLPPDPTNSKQSFLDLRCLQVEALIESHRIKDASALLAVLRRDHADDERLKALEARISAGAR